MNEKELKSCPFCMAENTDVGFVEHLTTCYLTRRFYGDVKQKLIDSWNHRPIEEKLQAEVKRLRDALIDIAHGPVGYWNLPEHREEVIRHMMQVARAALEPHP